MADDFGLYVTDILRKNAKDYRVKRPPTTKAGKALHAVAAFFGAIARTVLRRKNAEAARNFDVGSVLETFLREGEMFRNSTMANAEAARDARNRSTVVDEDGTEVAYHERGDRDVTAEDFERTFGIRFAMDGNARSQDTANVCYDTLLKLAKLMGVPQETLGIGGLLTLDVSVVEELLNPVFYPTNNTINLSIPNNVNVPEIATAATIVHEWTHALDRIVGLGRDADPNVEITEETTGALSHGIGPQVREELLQAGKRMTEALRNTRFYERISNDEEIKELDREDPEAQLFDPQEVFARALANYYLANELGRIPMFDEGLGPTMDELAEVGPILREFFDALKVGVNETTGVQTLYHISDSDRKNWDAMCDKLEHYAKLLAEGVPTEEALEQAFTKSELLSHVQVFSGAPDVLRLIDKLKYGFGDINGWQRFDERLPFKISVRDFAKIFAETSGIDLGAEHEHYLTRPQIRHLIDAIDDPLAVYVDPYDYDQRWGRIRDRPSGSLIFLTELFEEGADGVSSPVIVPIKIRIENKGGRHYRIMSAYGLNDEKKISDHLRTLENAPGLILYTNLGKLRELTEGGEKAESREQSEEIDNPPAYIPSRSRLGSDGLPVTRDTGLLTGLLRVASGYHATPENSSTQRIAPLTEEFFTHPWFRRDFPDWGKPSMPSIIDQPASETQGENKADPNEERKWHETRGAGSRFTETPLGQELVAKAFDVLVGVDADLLLRPWHYGEKRDPSKGLVTAGLGRELDMTEEKGFAAEVSARISRFGTREGDPTLREIRARCGSKERFYEVLGAVFEAAMGLKLGVQDVITQREFGTMEKRMPLYAWVIRHNAQARATALGRKAYIMGRAFAERLHKEALAEARAEVERQRAKASEARAQTREAKAQTRNAERREETARHKRMRAEFSAAEADFIARWKLAEERAISRMRRTCNKSECIKGRKGPVKGS